MDSPEEIRWIEAPGALPNDTSVKVAKSVHASTVTVGLDLKCAKPDTASVCYPDVCFAVEDYEDAFSSFVRSLSGRGTAGKTSRCRS